MSIISVPLLKLHPLLMRLVQVRTCVCLTTGTQLHQAVFGLLHSSFESEEGNPVLKLLFLPVSIVNRHESWATVLRWATLEKVFRLFLPKKIAIYVKSRGV